MIPCYYYVVNFDENGIKPTLIDKIKSDTPKITDNFKDLARMAKSIDIDMSSVGGWEKWAKSFDKNDKIAIKFFSDVDSGKQNIEDRNKIIGYVEINLHTLFFTLLYMSHI